MKTKTNAQHCFELLEGPPPPPSQPCSHRAAIQHINRVHELISQLQAFLLHPPAADGSSWSQPLGSDIIKEMMTHTASALFSLQSGGCCGSSNDDSDVQNKHSAEKRKKREGRRRRRKRETTWSIVTTVPHDDGYQWRKYGQKTIADAKYQRSYFRCTYLEQGCPARKTVQQLDSYADPPKFDVEYRMHHTCSTRAHETCSSSSRSFPFVMESTPTPQQQEAAASFHGSTTTTTTTGGSRSLSQYFQDQQHLSPQSTTAAAAAEGESRGMSLNISSEDRAQATPQPLLVPELARTVPMSTPVNDMVGNMDLNSLFSATESWDLDMLMGDMIDGTTICEASQLDQNIISYI